MAKTVLKNCCSYGLIIHKFMTGSAESQNSTVAAEWQFQTAKQKKVNSLVLPSTKLCSNDSFEPHICQVN